MAALDFGMALSRGMLPKSEKAQQDLLNLAGGRNIFKSEDWWNKAVDKQIKEGYREAEQGLEYLTKSGEYKTGIRQSATRVQGPITLPGKQAPVEGYSYLAPQDAVISGYKQVSTAGPISIQSGGAGYSGRIPIYNTRPLTVFRETDREDFTAGELKDIEVAAKAGASQAKKATATSEAAQRRLRRGTGGLVAKALVPGAEGVDTGLPALGQTGLGLGTSMLGKGFTL